MAKIGHPDEDRIDGKGVPLHLRAELFTAKWQRRFYTTTVTDVKDLVLSLEIFQEQNIDASHLDLFAFAQMAGLRFQRWPHTPRKQRSRR